MSSIPGNVPNSTYYVGTDKIMNKLKKAQTQLERFKEAAREHETDQSDDALDKVFGKLDLKREPEKEDKEKGGE